VSEGVDALGHPDPAALAAARKAFDCVYLKDTTRADVDALHAAGLGVYLIGESTGRRSLLGSGAGQTDAVAYLAQAAALGAPPEAAIIIAEVDFDAQPAELATIVAYYHGAQSVAGTRTWGYGGYLAVKALFDSRVITGALQTYGWSGTPTSWDGRAQLQQYSNAQVIAGTGVDLDRAMTGGLPGAWLPPTSPTAKDSTMLLIVGRTGYSWDGKTAPLIIGPTTPPSALWTALSAALPPAVLTATEWADLQATVMANTKPAPAVDPAALGAAIAAAFAAHPPTATIDPGPIAAAVIADLQAQLAKP
jgi:hypothetical protein